MFLMSLKNIMGLHNEVTELVISEEETEVDVPGHLV